MRASRSVSKMQPLALLAARACVHLMCACAVKHVYSGPHPRPREQ